MNQALKVKSFTNRISSHWYTSLSYCNIIKGLLKRKKETYFSGLIFSHTAMQSATARTRTLQHIFLSSFLKHVAHVQLPPAEVIGVK